MSGSEIIHIGHWRTGPEASKILFTIIITTLVFSMLPTKLDMVLV
jgi:hypothetical protein